MWTGTPLQTAADISLRALTSDISWSSESETAAPFVHPPARVEVTERRDPDLPIISGNDLIVVTKPRFGSVPPVRRLHALEPGWKNDFLYDV